MRSGEWREWNDWLQVATKNEEKISDELLKWTSFTAKGMNEIKTTSVRHTPQTVGLNAKSTSWREYYNETWLKILRLVARGRFYRHT